VPLFLLYTYLVFRTVTLSTCLGDSLDLLESNLLEVRQKQSTSWGGAERHKEERARRKRRLTRWSIHADGAKYSHHRDTIPFLPGEVRCPSVRLSSQG
jgi:hypothetical protein